MSRFLTSHKVNLCNDCLQIEVLDQPGSGGACHLYKITGFNSGSNISCPWTSLHGAPAVHSHILFQNGPIKEVGVNGVTHEALLAVIEDRLVGFQAGPYACPENERALHHIREAQRELNSRTQIREARGVEGTHAI